MEFDQVCENNLIGLFPDIKASARSAGFKQQLDIYGRLPVVKLIESIKALVSGHISGV